MLHFVYFWAEFREISLATELRFSFEITPVTNKTRGEKASSVMPPRPAGGIALPFLCLFPVPACLQCGHLPHRAPLVLPARPRADKTTLRYSPSTNTHILLGGGVHFRHSATRPNRDLASSVRLQ